MLSKKFDRYGWDRDRSKPSQDRLVEDWITALQDYTLEEVRLACRQAVEVNPNKMPNEGHIKKIILSNRTRYRKLQSPIMPKQKPRGDVVTQDQAEKILKEFGFNLKKMEQPYDG